MMEGPWVASPPVETRINQDVSTIAHLNDKLSDHMNGHIKGRMNDINHLKTE
jgi:hypothetical protein